ncbi:deoxyribodipyrimidine photolyase-related protein [Ruegeria intermedia]|uniref:Deoxyribodipyrimidine photolyase-related protein n=1 Tax=Ruegeria intermedia TaxID=996115 RepID=A0A1M5AP74_9RHOB|nr:cryptochrome/photolyase family protein [Ruegeria intermedia]SHF31966.1 deoxyribodipyrimidine photolyase-related protein [Ruegeria intermedia]
MVAPRLVLVLGDQLTETVAALRAADRGRDLVLMVEVMDEATHVPHHPQKIAIFFAAMRKFAARLAGKGWRVAYSRLDDPDNAGSIPAELLRRAEETGAFEAIATAPGDWRLRAALEAVPLRLRILEDDRFLCSARDFAAWAKGRKTLRMEWFYREMRRRTGLLMEGDAPAGGRWNFDAENRKPPKAGLGFPDPPVFAPDRTVREVLDIVADRFGAHFGELEPFGWPTDRDEALTLLAHFLRRALPCFGDFQDAMVTGVPVMFHSLLSPALNLGLLSPLEVCRAAEAEWRAGRAPLNAVEGFIRQILGWREFIRGVWSLEGPDYMRRNALGHRRKLPALYWGAPTRMRCMAEVVGQTRRRAYAHHIQRLMVTGNFALLSGVDPAEVHRWYLSVYADAVEWVEAPNTLGMSQFADGGMVASKPYVSSGAYINRMSDYCRGCAYDVTARTGPNACPFNLLYWHFLDRHRDRFAANPRMAQIYRGWDGRDGAVRARVLAEAEAFLARLDAGEPV